jgi:hypothetical protein
MVLEAHNGCSQKKSRMGLQDTTSLHICSKSNNIKNAHGKDQGLKNHGGRNHAPNQLVKLSSWKTKIFS